MTALRNSAPDLPTAGGVEIIEPYDPSKWTIVVVPEPSTWAMMLVGMGGLALAMRSRRRRPAPMAA